MPVFNPIDNATGHVDMEKHCKKEWSASELEEAIVKNSVYSWGASGPIHESAIHVDHAEGVYFFDKNGKKYIDWSAGAVCTNLGHTVPRQIATQHLSKWKKPLSFMET